MAIPISYNIRNLILRKGLTLMTALGIALTVTTAIFLMALVAGLDRQIGANGNLLKPLLGFGGRDRCGRYPHLNALRQHLGNACGR